MVGRNNVGKSTICEAMDLLLGSDRLRQNQPIDEYDFYNGQYLTAEGDPVPNEPIPIVIEGILTSLSPKAESTFAGHLEFWDENNSRLLSEGEIGNTDTPGVQKCLRLQFKGNYDPDEDEFVAKTYYSHSPGEEDENKLTEVYSKQKREIGFLYLRALRTGTRALSLERGSMLDVLLRVGQLRPRLWEDTRKRLMKLDPPLDNYIGSLRSVLDNIESRIQQIVSMEAKDKGTRLFVSQLTREHLRKTLAFFMSTSHDQEAVPFQRLGTGTLNTLVFALLTAIAEFKDENVIFAMEEPEIALPPHTQRRLVKYLLEDTTQSFVTSHSPYVIERFKPEQIQILRREETGNLSGSTVSLASGLKPKMFQRKLRHSIAEAMLGQAVIVGEGLVECQVIREAAAIMEGANPGNYPLDLSGITLFDSGGDGNLSEYGAFFRSIGLKTFAFYDLKTRSETESTAITSNFDGYQQTTYVGIELLLATEIPTSVQWAFLKALHDEGVLANGPAIPESQPSDDTLRRLVLEVLVDRKGDGRAARLIQECTATDLPATVRGFLETIYGQYPKPREVLPIQTAPIDDIIQTEIPIPAESNDLPSTP